MPPPTKEKVLDLEVRKRIVRCVGENPGLHLRALAERLELPVSTLEYHCYQLVKTDHLVTRETGGFKAFYPAEGMDRRDKDILYLVRQEGPRRVAAHLLLHPGSTPKDLKAATGLSGPTLSFHLKKLKAAELLHEEPAGRTKHLSLLEEERVANVLVSYRKSFLDDAVDAFASTWLELHPPRAKSRKTKEAEADAAGGERDVVQRAIEAASARRKKNRDADRAHHAEPGHNHAEDGPAGAADGDGTGARTARGEAGEEAVQGANEAEANPPKTDGDHIHADETAPSAQGEKPEKDDALARQ